MIESINKNKLNIPNANEAYKSSMKILSELKEQEQLKVNEFINTYLSEDIKNAISKGKFNIIKSIKNELIMPFEIPLIETLRDNFGYSIKITKDTNSSKKIEIDWVSYGYK